MSYITQADIELWFNNEVSLNSDLATDLINKNSAFVDKIAGTKFEPVAVTEYIDIDMATDLIRVSNKPVVSVSAVYVNKGSLFSEDYQSVDFILKDSSSGTIILKEAVSPGYR